MRRTYSGNVVGGLSKHLKDVDCRREVHILEVMHRFRVSPGILLLSHILHHLRFKLCVDRTRLYQGQAVERQTTSERIKGSYTA